MKKSFWMFTVLGLLALLTLQSCYLSNVPLPATNVYDKEWEGKYAMVIDFIDDSEASLSFVEIRFDGSTNRYLVDLMAPDGKGKWQKLQTHAQFSVVGDSVYFSYRNINEDEPEGRDQYLLFEVDRKKSQTEGGQKNLKLYMLSPSIFQQEKADNAMLTDEGIQFETSEKLAAFILEKREQEDLWENPQEKKQLGIEVQLYPLLAFPKLDMK